MKAFKILSVIVAVTLPLSCTNEFVEQGSDQSNEGVLIPYTLTSISAQPEDAVKSALQDNRTVLWEEGDKIAVYDGSAIREFTLKSGAGQTSAVFSGSISSDATHLEAVYPYSAAYLKDGVLSYAIPSDQAIPTGKSADSKALVSATEKVALGNPLAFHNKVGLLKFTVDKAATVCFISSDGIMSNDPEAPAIRLSCPAAGTYYAAVAPASYSVFNAFVDNKVRNATKPLTVKANGIVNIGDVTGGTESTLIWNCYDLNAYLADLSNDGYIMTNIDASAGITGATKNFTKKLEGHNCSVRNWTSNGVTLFAQNSGTIQNICLDKSCKLTFPNPITGYFAFFVIENNGTVRGLVNMADVNWKGPNQAATFIAVIVSRSAGATSTVSNCANYGNVVIDLESSSAAFEVGAIIGYMKGTLVDSCINEGDITVNHATKFKNANYLSGVCAYSTGKCEFKNCHNRGKLTHKSTEAGTGLMFGGVIGYCKNGSASIKDCTNSGDMKFISSVLAGSLIGGVAAYADCAVNNCTNSGDIEISGTSLKVLTKFGIIDGTNTKANAALIAGGIVGAGAPTAKDSFKFEANDCINDGSVKLLLSNIDEVTAPVDAGRNCVGGIVGDASGPVNRCDNNGDVSLIFDASTNSFTATTKGYSAYVGGIAGSNYYSLTSKELAANDCNNSGDILLHTVNRCASDGHTVAGIIGNPGANNASNTCITKNCINSGVVTGEGYAPLMQGGIMGNSGRIMNCTNTGTIVCKTSVNVSYVGGINGYHGSGMELVGCRNTGNIVSTNNLSKSACGGLVGVQAETAMSTGDACEANCSIEIPATSSAGMIVGGFKGTEQIITYGTEADPIAVGGSIKSGTAPAIELTPTNYNLSLAGSFGASESTHLFNARHISEPGPQTKDKTLNGTAIKDASNLYGLITDKNTGEGIAGVPVTDGYKYVKTDANGVYQMTADSKCLCVTMSVPAEYDIPMDEATHSPAFYANDLRSIGFNRRDFSLKPVSSPKTNFTIAAVGDLHIGHNSGARSSDWTKTSSERFRTTLADMRTHFAQEGYENVYCCGVGDEGDNNLMAVWPTIQAMCQNIPLDGGKYLPFFHCMGNHDHMGDCGKTETDFYINQRKRFVTFCGPADYSFNVGKAHIVVLDNAAYNGATAYRLYTPSWNWLQDDIAQVDDKANKLLLLIYHCPMCGGVAEDGAPRHNDHRVDILELAKQFHQAHFICGHTHRNEHYVHTDQKTKDGTAIIEHIHGMSGGTYWDIKLCPDGSPRTYGVYNIEGNEVTSYYTKAVNQDKGMQMRVYNADQTMQYPGNDTKYHWTNASMTMYNPRTQENTTVYGDPVLAHSFVVNLWCSNPYDWTVEFWQNGEKKGNLTRITTINDLMCNTYTFPNSQGNADHSRRDTGHYYYYKAPGGVNPSTVTGWTIKATHKVPGGNGKTMVYECSSFTTGFPDITDWTKE